LVDFLDGFFFHLVYLVDIGLKHVIHERIQQSVVTEVRVSEKTSPNLMGGTSARIEGF